MSQLPALSVKAVIFCQLLWSLRKIPTVQIWQLEILLRETAAYRERSNLQSIYGSLHSLKNVRPFVLILIVESELAVSRRILAAKLNLS